jgi:replication fork protection complex subunit Tof1/Swi1
MLPSLAKSRKEEKDERIISLGLHIVRNLLAIKDIRAEGTASGEKEELAHLQVRPTCLQLIYSVARCV